MVIRTQEGYKAKNKIGWIYRRRLAEGHHFAVTHLDARRLCLYAYRLPLVALYRTAEVVGESDLSIDSQVTRLGRIGLPGLFAPIITITLSCRQDHLNHCISKSFPAHTSSTT